MQMTSVIGKKLFLLISYLSVFLKFPKQTHFECFPWCVIINFWAFCCCFCWRHFLFQIKSVTINNRRKKRKNTMALFCIFKANQVWNVNANGFWKGNWIQNEDTMNYIILIWCALLFSNPFKVPTLIPSTQANGSSSCSDPGSKGEQQEFWALYGHRAANPPPEHVFYYRWSPGNHHWVSRTRMPEHPQSSWSIFCWLSLWLFQEQERNT